MGVPPVLLHPPRPPTPPHQLQRESVSGAGGTPARIVWSHEEDFVILRYVKEHGHDWKTLAEQLASRTPHAIRNRYHRLQTMALDTVEGANELLGESMLVDPSLLQVA